MISPDQFDTPDRDIQADGTPNSDRSGHAAETDKATPPTASSQSRWRSMASKTGDTAQAVVDRARPIAARYGSKVIELMRRLVLVLAPYAQRLQQWASPLTQWVKRRVEPHLSAVWAKIPMIDTGRHHRSNRTGVRTKQIGAVALAFGVLAVLVGVPNNAPANSVAGTRDGLLRPVAQLLPKSAQEAVAKSTGTTSTDDGKPVVPVAPNPTGIDVSNYQGTVNWTKVANSGEEFAFVLATDGADFTNPLFDEQFNGAKKAGLLVTGYHFARPSGSAVAQADRLMDTMGVSGDEEQVLPPVLDMEVNPSGPRCYGKTPAQMQQWVKTFLQEVKQRTGDKAIIYANPSFWSTCMAGTKAFSEYPLWLAEYGVSNPTEPAAWDHYSFWQYTAKGSVPGVSGNVDRNRFHGTPKELLQLAE